MIVEWKVAKEPMVPIRIFSNRTANTGFFGEFIHGLVLWAFAYYMIIFVRFSRFRAQDKVRPSAEIPQFLGARGDALFKSSAETLPGRQVAVIPLQKCSNILMLVLPSPSPPSYAESGLPKPFDSRK